MSQEIRSKICINDDRVVIETPWGRAPSKTPEKLCVDKFYAIMSSGKVAEWFNASVLKTDVVVRLPRVRLPLFPN